VGTQKGTDCRGPLLRKARFRTWRGWACNEGIAAECVHEKKKEREQGHVSSFAPHFRQRGAACRSRQAAKSEINFEITETLSAGFSVIKATFFKKKTAARPRGRACAQHLVVKKGEMGKL